MRMTPRKRALAALLLLILLIIPVFLAALWYSQDVTALRTQYPHLRPTESGMGYEISEKIPRHWVPLKSISPFVRGAIVLSEDWGFYDHMGVDFVQIQDALGDFQDTGNLRGASTITQQVVKNIFLHSRRSLFRKFHEAVLSWRLERAVSKERILEIYLNSIEFGSNIYGIRAASLYYFQQEAAEVQPREAAFLAMILPNPRWGTSSFRKKKISPSAQKRIGEILTKMRQGKVITPEQFEMEINRKFSWEF